MVQRQSITAESIYGDEFDADPVVTLSDVESPSEGQNSNPESEDHTSAKDKRHQFLRQNSVLQYMRDQKSIDDDPVNILQKMQSVNGRHATRRRTSSISAACPNSSLLCNGTTVNFDQLDDLPMDNVSPEVYSFYLRALGKSSVSVAVALYICYQVPYNFFPYVLYLLPECTVF